MSTATECAVDFCTRPAKIKAKNAGIIVCKGHYQQDWNGRAFTTFKQYRNLPQDDAGRVCTACDEYKSWDEFYDRPSYNKTAKQSTCKRCMIKQERERQERRQARGIPCTVIDCPKPVLNRGLCKTHYGREYHERTKTSDDD